MNYKEQIKVKMKTWKLANPEKVKAYNKTWRITHPKQKKAYNKAWRLAHPEYIKAWKLSHPERVRIHDKTYNQTLKGKKVNQKHEAKRHRQLGFIPLNEPFNDCEGHHWDALQVDLVIYIVDDIRLEFSALLLRLIRCELFISHQQCIRFINIVCYEIEI